MVSHEAVTGAGSSATSKEVPQVAQEAVAPVAEAPVEKSFGDRSREIGMERSQAVKERVSGFMGKCRNVFDKIKAVPGKVKEFAGKVYAGANDKAILALGAPQAAAEALAKKGSELYGRTVERIKNGGEKLKAGYEGVKSQANSRAEQFKGSVEMKNILKHIINEYGVNPTDEGSSVENIEAQRANVLEAVNKHFDGLVKNSKQAKRFLSKIQARRASRTAEAV